jgi:hypothetical protein
MTWGGVAPPGGKYTAPWAAPWIEFLVFLRQNAIINANTTGVGHEINQFQRQNRKRHCRNNSIKRTGSRRDQ